MLYHLSFSLGRFVMYSSGSAALAEIKRLNGHYKPLLDYRLSYNNPSSRKNLKKHILTHSNHTHIYTHIYR